VKTQKASQIASRSVVGPQDAKPTPPLQMMSVANVKPGSQSEPTLSPFDLLATLASQKLPIDKKHAGNGMEQKAGNAAPMQSGSSSKKKNAKSAKNTTRCCKPDESGVESSDEPFTSRTPEMHSGQGEDQTSAGDWRDACFIDY